MKRYLKLQEENMNDIDPKNYAYLKDRVLIRRGEPQKFGTQSHFVNGVKELSTLGDPDNINQRRKKFGLEPLAGYPLN